jgi:enoyl-CoA hydratase/carnithine racemase
MEGARLLDILLEERHHPTQIVLLTLNQPEVLNAFNPELGRVLNANLERQWDDLTVRVLILAGDGDAFSIGDDVTERHPMNQSESVGCASPSQEVYRKLGTFPKPSLWAINGMVLDGGLEMTLSADFCYASTPAWQGFPEVSRGISPGVGGTQTVWRFTSRERALELLMTGQPISALEAYHDGLVNKVLES